MTQLFISYSRVDKPLAAQVASNLRRVFGYPGVWFDEELQGGQRWWQEILSQIEKCDIFIMLLSPEALASHYCRKEMEHARRHGKPILPVLARARTPIPADIQNLQLVDLSNGVTVDSITSLYAAINYLFREVPPTLPTRSARSTRPARGSSKVTKPSARTLKRSQPPLPDDPTVVSRGTWTARLLKP